MLRRRHAVFALVAGAALFVVAVMGVDSWLGRTTQADATTTTEPVLAGSALPGLDDGIAAAQQRLEDVPGDWTTWASLGVAYVEQARITADPTYYERADGALERSLEERPEDNDLALTGLGALANARHDFEEGARRARGALEINPANDTSWGVLADALIQLGDYDAATDAAQEMVDLRPTLASLTRASYDLELHGDLDRARETLERALETTSGGAGAAWVHTHLGLLAFNNGDLDAAREDWVAGLDVVPDDPALLAGLARIDAAEGDEATARERWESVVAARPLPEYLAEYGTWLRAIGDDEAAQEQFDVLEVVQTLFEDNGVADDLTGAHLEADFGDPDLAVEYAQRERARRQNIESADALAWALHAAGRDDEALPLAVEATALEGRTASYLYHRGIIEQSLGMDDQARRHLREALDTNPYFSPLHAPRAQAALDALGSS